MAVQQRQQMQSRNKKRRYADKLIPPQVKRWSVLQAQFSGSRAGARVSSLYGSVGFRAEVGLNYNAKEAGHTRSVETTVEGN